MDVTIMELITSLLKQLTSAKPATPSGKTISFVQGDGFYWEPKSITVFYNKSEHCGAQLLLHELGHAQLGHGSYNKDIGLIAMERAAWEQSLQLGAQYNITISNDLIEEHLDSYRDWLHARSLCPFCNATGLQTAPGAYQCLSCNNTWQVNEARTCGLKRYKATKKPE